MKMKLVPPQGLAALANLKSSWIVLDGAGSIFSAFPPCLWEFFCCPRQRDIPRPPACLRERERERKGRMRGGGKKMGTLKKNPCFLSKHRQWLKAPSRWQEVAKDPPKPVGLFVRDHTSWVTCTSPRESLPGSVLDPRASRRTHRTQHLAPWSRARLLPGSGLPSSRCRGPAHPNSNRPIHQTQFWGIPRYLSRHSSSRDNGLGQTTPLWGLSFPM